MRDFRGGILMNSDIMGCFRETILFRRGGRLAAVLETGRPLKENSLISLTG